LFVLAAAESTVFFWFPFGVDAAVILLVARNEDRAWMYPLIATAGSLIGTAATLWMGKKIGESGIARYVPERRLKAVKAKVKQKGAVAIALLGVIPPPFPFTPFVLASGALKMNVPRFLAALTLVRLARFGLEAWLAARFGRLAIRWLNSDAMQYTVGGLVVLALAGTAVMLYQLLRQRRLAAG
jgi:membrane protein YqaA with SNARE-associated domain